MVDAKEQQKSGYALRKQLGFKVSRAARLMQQRLETDLARENMTRLTWCVLSSVGIEGISTPSEVADNLGVTRPALSRLIKSMSRDGLIQSALATGDGRNRQLSLTEVGQRKLEVCLPLVQSNNVHFAFKLSKDHVTLLHGVLDLLLEGEETHLDTL